MGKTPDDHNPKQSSQFGEQANWVISHSTANSHADTGSGLTQSIFGYDDASLIASVCSDARLVPERILRRIARERHSMIDQGRIILHDDLAVIPDSLLIGLIDNDELAMNPGDRRPDMWILLNEFSNREQSHWSDSRRRRELWRRLFHGMIDQSLLNRRISGQWRRSLVRAWSEALGESTLKEIQTVLYSDQRILGDTSDAQMLAEFASVYLELKWFEPEALPLVFPGLSQLPAEALSWITREVPCAQFYEASKLPGSDLQSPWTGLEWITEQWRVSQSDHCPSDFHEDAIELSQEPSVKSFDQKVLSITQIDAETDRMWSSLISDRLKIQMLGGDDAINQRLRNALAIGLKSEKNGNFVGAARWLKKAQRYAREKSSNQTTGIHPEQAIRGLGQNLAHVLKNPGDEKLWQMVLIKVFESDRGSFWTRNIRLLYDLQKVVHAWEHPLYVIDWGATIRSLGTKPARRNLPNLPYVLMLRHLRTALGRLPVLQVDETVKRILRRLLERSIHQVEHRFRTHIRPILETSMAKANIVPMNLPEKVALQSVIDQLIDIVVEQGYFTLGHLRDNLSRNDLKLQDLQSIKQWWKGDSLLQADRILEQQLLGIYRRGEIYLRGLQRASSAVFARPLGRTLTWFVTLPFLGAFMLMGGLYFIPEELNHWVLESFNLHIHVPHQLNPIEHPRNILFVGLFMLAMIHHSGFRDWFLQTLRRTGLYLRGLLWDWPRRVLATPIIKLVFGSRWMILAWKWVLKPLLITALIWSWIPDKQLARNSQLITGLITIYLAMMIAVNSRAGRDFQEHLGEWLTWTWQRFGVALLVGVYRFLIDLFDKLSETVNRALYAIDEWIRYRRRSGMLVQVTSGFLGLVWGVVLYVFRFVFNLLVEPQLNPIKHFPVVTVSHKFLLPMIPILASAIQSFTDEDKKASLSMATVIMSLIPGAIGFIVWELKENWKLYEANRPKEIGPRPIGHHGETLLRLLHPGFHSGTVPKLLHRTRRARIKALRNGRMRSIVTQTQKLHHVHEALRRFVEREWLRLINASALFRESPLTLGQLGITNHSVTLEIRSEGDSKPMILCLKSENSWIVADLIQPGWTAALEHDQWQHLRVSLAGFMAQCGVDITESQVLNSSIMRPLARVMVDSDGLVVFPDPLYRPGERLIYDLTQIGEIEPRTKSLSDPLAIFDSILPEWRTDENGDEPWPVLDSRHVNLKQTPVYWSEWVAYWGKGGRPGRLPERARLEFLPKNAPAPKT